MNKGGNPGTLVAAQPGNANAVKHGVHSHRLIEPRAAQIATELTHSFQFSPTQRLAAQEAARCMAILEAIDRDLDERGLEDKTGKPRYLLNHRWRASRQLDHWLAKISDAIQRQSAGQPPAAERSDYVRELERIALHDPSAKTRDRLAALKELRQPQHTPGAVLQVFFGPRPDTDDDEKLTETVDAPVATKTIDAPA
jgi:hypothetical protein